MRARSYATAMLLTLLSAPAMAQTVTVIRPGLACISADALARLTLHGGDSRLDTPNPSSKAIRLAAQGGCVDLRIGQTMVAQVVRRNTVIVTMDAGQGRGAQTFLLPSIDVRITPGPAAAAPGPAPVTPAPRPAGYFTNGGVALGATLAEAKAALQAKYHLDESFPQPSHPAVTNIGGYAAGGNDLISLVLLDDRVVYIYRRLHFAGTRPASSALRQRTLQAFGPQGHHGSNANPGWSLEWWYGANGDPERPHLLCDVFDRLVLPSQEPSAGRMIFLAAPPASPTCHKFISASVYLDERRNPTDLIVYLYDADPLRSYLRTLQDAAGPEHDRKTDRASKPLAPL